jgi:hypothetical protein
MNKEYDFSKGQRGKFYRSDVEVTVPRTGEPSFKLNETDEAEILEAIAEADRGEALDADEVLARL